MRILTPSEVRQIEGMKQEIARVKQGNEVTVSITPSNAELWLNLLEMVLQTNAALGIAWRQSQNPNTDIVELVRGALS